MAQDYLEHTAKSQEWYQRAQQVYPRGVSYLIRYISPHPFYVKQARGSRLWDVDGNEYVDFWVGHGALLLGHAYAPLVEAMKEQIELGTHWGFSHQWEVLHAEQVVKMVPSVEMVRLANSGTEANMYAVRLARAFTGREKIGKFEGGWHGSYDALHIGVSPPLDEPDTAGITRGAQADTVLLPFNDLERVKEILRKTELAGVVVEAVQGAAGFIPAEPEFLRGLRQLCAETGTLLIMDEVITGFRLAPGGAQELYGVLPDLTVMGKTVGGGGLAIGAIGGKRKIMELMDPAHYPEKSRRVFHGGTYAANPLVTRAGFVALKELDDKRNEIYPHLNRLGEKARQGLTAIFQEAGLRAWVTGMGSLFCVHFTEERPTDIKGAYRNRNNELYRRYFYHLLNRGIAYVGLHSPHFFLCAAHSEEDVDRLLQATRDFAVAH